MRHLKHYVPDPHYCNDAVGTQARIVDAVECIADCAIRIVLALEPKILVPQRQHPDYALYGE